MTAVVLAGASSAYSPTWGSINWTVVEQQVNRLQMRIAKVILMEQDAGHFIVS